MSEAKWSRRPVQPIARVGRLDYHPGMNIRAATSADVPTILNFIRELAEFEKLSADVVATEELLQQNLFSEKPAAEVLIAEIEARPVGFALYFTSFSTFLARPGIYLEDLYVSPSARSAGVGRALLAHLASIAVARGCGRLEWSVLDWNTRAWDFYRELGAVPMTEWTQHRLTGAALTALAALGN